MEIVLLLFQMDQAIISFMAYQQNLDLVQDQKGQI